MTCWYENANLRAIPDNVAREWLASLWTVCPAAWKLICLSNSTVWSRFEWQRPFKQVISNVLTKGIIKLHTRLETSEEKKSSKASRVCHSWSCHQVSQLVQTVWSCREQTEQLRRGLVHCSGLFTAAGVQPQLCVKVKTICWNQTVKANSITWWILTAKLVSDYILVNLSTVRPVSFTSVHCLVVDLSCCGPFLVFPSHMYSMFN